MKPKALKAKCDECPLAEEPFVPTTGPKKAKRAIIGFAPGSQEVRKGKCFIGPSGRVLDVALDHANLNREELLITNAVLCKTPRNREPEHDEIQCCKPRLIHELKSAGVVEIMTAGKVPRVALLPDTEEASMTNTRGVWAEADKGFKVLPSWHPAYVLHGQPTAMTDILKDAVKFAKGYTDPPEVQQYLVKDRVELKKIVHQALAKDKKICFDLETSNRDMKRSTPAEWWNGFILCMGFSWRKDVTFVIDRQLFNSKETLKVLWPLFENPKGLYGHNVKFDANYAMYYYRTLFGEEPNLYLCDDTLLMHYLLDENSEHGLKANAQYELNVPDWESVIHSYLKYPKKDSYAKVPENILLKYMATDVSYTMHLYDIYMPQILEQQLDVVYTQVIIPATNVLHRVEARGILLDDDRLSLAKVEMEKVVDECRESMRDMTDWRDFNPNAPHQVAEVLFDMMGMRQGLGKRIGGKRGSGKVGPRSTNKEVLEKLSELHPDNQFIKLMQKYRRWNKMLTTYANKLPLERDQNGVSHFEYKIQGTETGRLSAGRLMTIPRKFTPEGKMLRNSFVARPGYKWIGADFSQAELRWGGWYSQEPFLYNVYQNDLDLHSEVALAMYGEHWTKEDRIHAKMFNFAYLYGGTEFSFANDAGLPIDEAKKWVHRYNGQMPKLAQWRKDIFTRVKSRGELITAIGRRRRFPVITSKNQWEVKNSATNFPVQSISSDATLWGFCSTSEILRNKGIDAHPVLFMHDGAYIEVRDNDKIIMKVARIFRRAMLDVVDIIQTEVSKKFEEFADNEYMPFKIDLEIGPSWGELEDLEI